MCLSIFFGNRHGFGRNIDGIKSILLLQIFRKGYDDVAAAGADVEDGLIFWRQLQNLFDERFGFRTGDKSVFRDLKIEAKELFVAQDIGQRLLNGSTRDQSLNQYLLACCQFTLWVG